MMIHKGHVVGGIQEERIMVIINDEMTARRVS